MGLSVLVISVFFLFLAEQIGDRQASRHRQILTLFQTETPTDEQTAGGLPLLKQGGRWGTLTLAHYTCVLSMDAVVLSKTWMLTILNEILVPLAHDIIHPDRTTPTSKPEVMNERIVSCEQQYQSCKTVQESCIPMYYSCKNLWMVTVQGSCRILQENYYQVLQESIARLIQGSGTFLQDRWHTCKILARFLQEYPQDHPRFLQDRARFLQDLPKILARASKILARPSKILARPSKILTRPSKILARASSKILARASKIPARPSKILARPSKILARPSKIPARPSKILARPSEILARFCPFLLQVLQDKTCKVLALSCKTGLIFKQRCVGHVTPWDSCTVLRYMNEI